jgi:hypothetical protein
MSAILRRALLGALLAGSVISPAPADAGPIPSKSGHEAATAADDRARLEAVLARAEVARALAAHGLEASEVEARLAELAPEDLRSLAANLDQVQAAGNVPNYIWILLGIFLAVSILAIIF